VGYYPEAPAQRSRAILGDVVVVALLALFAWLGITVNDTFDDLASLGRGVEEAGNSVQGGFEDAGGLLADTPIVGGSLEDAFTEVGAQTGGTTMALGQAGESAVEDTASLLGWVTFALPALVVLLWAVPRRVVRVRKLNAAGRALGDAPSAERRRLLAMRAAFGLPYETLRPYTPIRSARSPTRLPAAPDRAVRGRRVASPLSAAFPIGRRVGGLHGIQAVRAPVLRAMKPTMSFPAPPRLHG
jgi:hypothetical protein